MRKSLARAALFLTLTATPVLATTIIMPTDDQLIDKSDSIVIGRVLRSEPVLIDEHVWTDTEIAISVILKGDPALGPTVIIRDSGGTIGDRTVVIEGQPHYEVGSEVLTFLKRARNGDLRTTDLFAGKFDDITQMDGT